MFSPKPACPRVVIATAVLLLIVVAAVPALAAGGCPADVNSDGVVGINDLLIVLQEWGQGSGTSDFSGVDQAPDGVVDIHDFLGVLAEWGPCS